MSPSRRKLLLFCLLIAALACLWLTLRWFEGRWLRPFVQTTQVFSGEALRLPQDIGGKGAVRLVHFFDPACPCNALNQQHLGELIERYGARGVAFYAVQKPRSEGHLPAPLAALKPLPNLPGADNLPASPALAIFDQDGELAYFGPYSEGALCNSENSFVEPIIEALLAGKTVKASHNLAVGCFCDWQGTP